MAIERQNFTMWKGETKCVTFTVEDVETLAGCAIRWKLAKRPHDEPLVTKSDTDGITISNNEFTVTIDPGDTITLQHGLYYHESEITDTSEHISTVATGWVHIKPSVMR